MSGSARTYLRFTLAQRVEHAVALVTFVVLAVTGLPQKYATAGWAEAMIGVMGGIEAVRVIHRVAATVLMIATVYHIGVVGYKLYVQRARLSMLPTLTDLTDAWHAFLHNLGLRREPAQAGRYSFAEKAEYWAFVWGAVVMVITGFMLWNPIATTNVLPGQAIPAAKAAHGGEALLAVLAIILWHMYHVHLRSFNKSMFTGRMSEHEMLEEHPRELADLKAGLANPRVDPAAARQRSRLYLPVAGLLSAALLFGVYRFITFEETAIATIERPRADQVFVPLTPTPRPTPLPSPTPLALDPVWAGNIEVLLADRCVQCHGGAAGLDLATHSLALQGSDSGPVIVPGDSANSLLLTKIAGGRHPGRLSEPELQVLAAWIDAGAPEN
jgi:cytochrome b subunit of formate dehydrogenase